MKLKNEDNGIRHNNGKPMVSLIDPEFILGMAEVLTEGMKKYDKHNWQKGLNFSDSYDSAMRHLLKFWAGKDVDHETSLNELLHSATNLMFMYYHYQNRKDLDDRNFKRD